VAKKTVHVRPGRFSMALNDLTTTWESRQRKTHLLLSAALIAQLAQRRQFAANDGLQFCIRHIARRGPAGIDGIFLSCLGAAAALNIRGFADAISELDSIVPGMRLQANKGMLIPFGDLGRVGLQTPMPGGPKKTNGTFLLTFGSDLSRSTLFSTSGLLSSSFTRPGFDFGFGTRSLLQIPGFGATKDDGGKPPTGIDDKSLYGVTNQEHQITYWGLRIGGAITGAIIGSAAGPGGAFAGAGVGWGLGAELADGVLEVAEHTDPPPQPEPAPEPAPAPDDDDSPDDDEPPDDDTVNDEVEYVNNEADTVVLAVNFTDPRIINTTPVQMERVSLNISMVQLPMPLEQPQTEDLSAPPGTTPPDDRRDWNRQGGNGPSEGNPGNRP
jgi:hypothetical protein